MSLLGKLFPLAMVLGASALGAQAKPTCDADATKGGLAKAAFTVEQARTSQGTPGTPAILTTAIKQLEAVKGEDPTLQALFLGQTLSFWLSQPNMSLTPRRGALGFTTNPEATIDLVPTIDSLFHVVEVAKPGCAELTNAYRGGLQGYLNLVNGAIAALNADKVDSAEALATAANRLYPGGPYGPMVLGSIAAKRNDNAKALQYWAAAADAAAKDTVYRDVQRQMLQNQGTAYLITANASSGAERAAAARKATEMYTQLLAIPGTTGAVAAGGRQSMQQAQLLLGDTTAFVASYQPLLANPASYDYMDLLNTAVNAARANRSADAARLFEATLTQNPYSRDALFNLAVTYLAMEQNDKVAPVVTRLVALDPSDPEVYNLAARAYLGMGKAAKAAKNTKLEAALNDTTMQWYTRGNRLPSEVTVTQFSSNDKQVVIAGTVLDRRDKIEPAAATVVKGKAAKAPAKPVLSPAAVTIKIEALDKSGAVLGTQTVTTEALSPGQTAKFTATIPAANAVAYRYSVGG